MERANTAAEVGRGVERLGRRTDRTGGLSLLIPVQARTAEVSETENKSTPAVVMP